MALSTTQEQQIKPIIQDQGGLEPFIDAVRASYIKDRQAAALTALQSAISVSVTDWAALGTYIAQADNVTLYSVLDAITAAAMAKDASKLGPLMVALYAAVRKHLGK